MKNNDLFEKRAVPGKNGVYIFIDKRSKNGDSLDLEEIDRILRCPAPKVPTSQEKVQ